MCTYVMHKQHINMLSILPFKGYSTNTANVCNYCVGIWGQSNLLSSILIITTITITRTTTTTTTVIVRITTMILRSTAAQMIPPFEYGNEFLP